MSGSEDKTIEKIITRRQVDFREHGEARRGRPARLPDVHDHLAAPDWRGRAGHGRLRNRGDRPWLPLPPEPAAKQGGSIVNVASILGERVAKGVAPYAISKAGVVQATKALALELARHQIRVNALLPGYVITDLNRDFLTSEPGEKLRSRIPSQRFSEMRDLDGAMLLLASDAGAAMSGATVAVDGGHLVNTL